MSWATNHRSKSKNRPRRNKRKRTGQTNKNTKLLRPGKGLTIRSSGQSNRAAESTCSQTVIPFSYDRTYEFVQLDVFTRTRLTGNPLAVFTDARGLTDKDMQAPGREMNLSETTFVLPRR